MTAPIRLYNLGPSPNSTKVRYALGFKGIPYETIHVDPQDREAVVKISGQPLTPVLTHGDTVIFDSSAILRYLEANVKREPRLFSADYDEMQAIERWESWTRTSLSPHVGQLFGQFFAESRDKDAIRKAVTAINEAGRHLESSLSPSGWLVGDRTTAGDVTAAAWFSLGYLTPEAAKSHPILEYFRENLTLDPERRALRSWWQSISRHDH
jgi:glutathione S-transferase